jgi:hypothetical protein
VGYQTVPVILDVLVEDHAAAPQLGDGRRDVVGKE